jgi:tetratricopeptide (TPR) repeat protein
VRIALEKNYVTTALGAYNELGIINQSKREKAKEYLEKAFELAKKAGMIGWISWFGIEMGFWYGLYQGDMKRAVPLLEESVALSRRVGFPGNLGQTLGMLGWIQLILGESEKAEQCFREAF